MSLQPVHDSVLPILGKHLRNYEMKHETLEHDEERVEKPKCDETRMSRRCHVLCKCLDLLLDIFCFVTLQLLVYGMTLRKGSLVEQRF